MTSNLPAAKPTPTTPLDDAATPRIRIGFVAIVMGFLLFAVGAKPDWLGWDRSPTVGFVQIIVFLAGLGILCLGGYIGIVTLWWGYERTILSEIGTRLAATGYVVTVFTGLADIFGMGSQSFPQTPYFGPWQATGVLIGQGVIALGFLLFLPYRPKKISP
ncbi:MAG: hypothetical protein IT310_03535 [Anaerolineales bacterium]|nr:hypothetical protein [Anaerolineales bacterium]